MRRVLPFFVAVLLFGGTTFATIFGTVRGVVHDPQHRPVADAKVILKAKTSDYTQSMQTDTEGQFQFDAIPLGEYTVEVS